jgi:hypothetical protein
MKIASLTGLATAALLLAPGVAQAGCASFESQGTGLSVRYDPFSGAPVNHAFNLRVSRTDPSVTAVRFILIDPDPRGGRSQFGAAGPQGYEVEWAKDASRPVFFSGAEQPNATNGAVVSFKPGPSGDVVNETFRLAVPAGRSVGAGDYYEPLEVRYVCYSGDEQLDSPESQQGGRVALDLETPDMISAYVGSVGVRRGEIDLGVLGRDTGSTSGTVVVTAQSTSPYELSVSSRWGVLRRGETDTAGLRYSMRLGGVPVEAGSTLVCDRTPSPSGRSHPLQVTVRGEDVVTQPAGAYSDVVTLTFSPRLGLSAGSGCSI